MKGVDFSQVRQMMRSALRSVVTSAEPSFSVPHPSAKSILSPSETAPDRIEVSAQARQQAADTVLRTLANIEDRASMRFTRPETGADAPPGAALEAVFSDNALRGQVLRVFSQPEVLEKIPEFLGDPILRETALQLLARPEMTAVARDVFLTRMHPETAALLLAETTARNPMIRILSGKEMAEFSRQALESPSGEKAALSLLQTPDGQALLARLMAHSENLRPMMLEILNRATAPHHAPEPGEKADGNREAITRSTADFLLRADMRAPTAALLREKETSADFLRLLTRPGMEIASGRIIRQPETQEALARWLKQSPARIAALDLLAQHRLDGAARAFLLRPETIKTMAGLLHAPGETLPSETRSAVLRIFAGVADDPAGRPALLSSARGTTSLPEQTMGVRDLQDAARAVLERPEARSRIPELLGDPKTRSSLLQILSQSAMTPIARTVLPAFPEGRAAITEALAIAGNAAKTGIAQTDMPPRGSGLPPESIAAIRILSQILSAPAGEKAPPAAFIGDIIKNQETPTALTRLFNAAETRPAALDVLTRPEFSQIARQVFSVPEQHAWARFLALQAGTQSQAQAARLLAIPEAAREMLAVLAQSEHTEAAERFFARKEVQAQIARLLAESETRVSTLNALAGLRSGHPAFEEILTRPEVRASWPGLLARPETRAVALQVLARADAVETTRLLLAQPETIETFRLIFTAALEKAAQTRTTGNQNLPAFPAQDAEAALRVLSQVEFAEAARRVFGDSAQAREALAALLKTAAETRPLAAPTDPAPRHTALVVNMLRMMAQSPMGSVTRAVFEKIWNPGGTRENPALPAPESVRSWIPQWITRIETRAPVLEILTRPEMADLAKEIFRDPNMQTALGHLVRLPQAPPGIIRLLSASPELALPLLNVLARPENSESAARLLNMPEIQKLAPELIRRAETREAFLRILQPEILARAAALLDRSDVQEQMARWVRDPQGRLAALTLLEQSSLANLPLTLLRRSDIQKTLLQIALGTDTARPVSAEEQAVAMRLLARPEQAETARAFLRSAELLAPASSRAPASSTAESSQLIAFLKQPAARLPMLEILVRNDLPRAILQALLRPEGTDTLTSFFRTAAATDAPLAEALLVRLLTRPEMARAAAEILQRPEVAPQIPRLLMQSETRLPVLELLARAEMALLARVVFAGNAGRMMAVELATAQDASARIPALLQHPDIGYTLLAALAEPRHRETAARFFQQPEAQKQAAALLTAGQTPEPAGISAEQAAVRARQYLLLRLMTRPDMAQIARDIFARPETQNALPLLLQAAETRAAALDLLLRPHMTGLARELMGNFETIRALAGILIAPEQAQQQRALLEILARPDMAETARTLWSQPEIQEQTARLLQDAEIRPFLLRALASPQALDIAARILERADAKEALANLLRFVPASGIAGQPLREQQEEILRFLSRTETASVARDIFNRPNMLPHAARLFAEPATRAAMLEILLRPETGEAANRVFSHPEIRARLSEWMANPRGEALAARLLAAPQSAAALLDILSERTMADAAKRILAHENAQSSILRLLGEPATRDAALALLARPEMRDAAQTILSRLDTPAGLAKWMQSPRSRAALLAVLAESSPALRTELHPVLQKVFSTPQTLKILIDLFTHRRLEGVSIADLYNAQAARRSEQSAALRVLAWSEMAETARRVFLSPETRETLARMLLEAAEEALAAQKTPPPAGAPARLQPSAPPDISSLLRLLARPDMAAVAQRIFALQETRNVLAELLSPPQDAPIAAAADRAIRDAAAILRILSRPELSDTARDVFSRIEIQSRVAQFLFQPETRAATLEILAKPEMTDMARAIFQRHPEAPAALIRAIFSLPLEPHAARLLKNPVLAGLVLEAMAQPEHAANAARLLKRADIQTQVAPWLADAETRENALRLLARPELAQNTALILERPDVRTQILRLAQHPDAAGHLRLMLQRPEMSRALAALVEIAADKNIHPPQVAAFLDAIQKAARTPENQPPAGTVFNPPLRENIPPAAILHPHSVPGHLPQREEQQQENDTRRQAPDIATLAVARDAARTQAAAQPRAEAARIPDFIAALRPDAAAQFVFHYHLATLFPWYNFSQPFASAAFKHGIRTENGVVIPSMMDIVLMEPLLLGYEPGELLVPGTDIPLIFPPRTPHNTGL